GADGTERERQHQGTRQPGRSRADSEWNSRSRSTASSSGPAQGVTTVKYMLLIYMADDAMTDAERQACYQESTQLTHDLHARGQYLAANPLHPISTATSVRVREGKSLVTDGPFAETREHLGGYFLIDAPNLDEAIRIATRIPGARKGTVEIRPVLDIPGLPTPR